MTRQRAKEFRLGSVVVTGAAGFIGSHLSQALLRTGIRVLGIDTRPARERGIGGNLRTCLQDRRFRFVQADLRGCDVRPLLIGSDAVFHLAALAGVRSSWGDRFEEYLAVNVQGTHRLLQACEQAGVPRMVLASSSSVYGVGAGGPSSESHATSPLSPYGVTKLAAERLAMAYAQHPTATTSVVALRYFSVYGPRQRADMLINRVLEAVNTGRTFTLFGNGEQRRDFTFVGDVVAATLAAAHAPAVAEVLNVGTGVTRSVRDVLTIAERLTGRHVQVVHEPAAAGDVDATWADTTRAAQMLNHHSLTGLEAGMAAHWAWMNLNHERQAEPMVVAQEGVRL
jgi:UDP-glucuronate 4-epimerase